MAAQTAAFVGDDWPEMIRIRLSRVGGRRIQFRPDARKPGFELVAEVAQWGRGGLRRGRLRQKKGVQ